MHAHTYGDVLDRATALTRALVDAGVAPGDRVGCYLPNSPSWVVASFAVWFAGGAVAAAGTLMPPVEAATLVRAGRREDGRDDRGRGRAGPRLHRRAHRRSRTARGRAGTRRRRVGRRRPAAARIRRPRGRDLHFRDDGTAEGCHAHARRHRGGRARRGRGLRAHQRLPPRPRARAPRAGRALQPVRAHGRLQPARVPHVDRPGALDRAEVHGRGGTRTARAVRHGLVAALAHDDPHARRPRRRRSTCAA